jgi:tRNA(fMet)-specific endonuclease VapC
VKYLLDTDTCIYIIKRRPESVARRFRKMTPGDAGISAITLCELNYGLEKSRESERNRSALEEFVGGLEVFAFEPRATGQYGKVRAGLERSGKPIGALDTLIAAHALDLGACLVTNNTREFSRVPGLKTENWIA